LFSFLTASLSGHNTSMGSGQHRQTDVAFYFMSEAQWQASVYHGLHWHPNIFLYTYILIKYTFSNNVSCFKKDLKIADAVKK
jgi:hypothetical protein